MNPVNADARIRMIRARTSLMFNHPFFASLSLRLDMKEDPSCANMWTDGKVVAYNPAYVEKVSPELLEGIMAHTVMHPACGHHRRRCGRDHAVWNRACDYAINWILVDAGLKLPEGYLYDEAFREKTAEEIYDHIYITDSNPSDLSNNVSDLMEDENTFETDDRAPVAENGDPEGEEEEESDAGSGDQKEDDENDEGGSEIPGEVRDAPESEKEGDASEDETDWETALVQAALSARGMGKMPAGVDRFVEKFLNPSLPWEELLSRFIESSAKSDYSWMTPNRRFIQSGLYFPSLKNDELPEIVIAVDTSGSVSPHEVDRFAAEITAIFETRPSRIHLLYCDRSVVSFEVVERHDLPIEIKPLGGGGTDFRPAFEHVMNQCIRPSCFIYLTDMECRHFPEEPSYPVLWVKTGEGTILPPFGEVISMV